MNIAVKALSPTLIWSMLVVLCGVVAFTIRLEAGVGANTDAVLNEAATRASSDQHMRELQTAENENVQEKFDDIKSDVSEIKRLIRELAKED